MVFTDHNSYSQLSGALLDDSRHKFWRDDQKCLEILHYVSYNDSFRHDRTKMGSFPIIKAINSPQIQKFEKNILLLIQSLCLGSFRCYGN